MKGEQRESVGEEMTLVLSVLGQILVEVADAQVSMCQSLEALLSLLLEAFAGVDWEERRPGGGGLCRRGRRGTRSRAE